MKSHLGENNEIQGLGDSWTTKFSWEQSHHSW